MARVLIFGAGALGTFYGGRLAQAGHDVTVVARGDTLARIREHGLRWREGGVMRQVQVDAVVAIPDTPFDFALVLVRAQHLEDVLPLLGAIRSPSVVMMVNNAGSLEPYRQMLGARVVLGFPGAAGQRGADGIWECQTVPRWVQPTTLGELEGPATRRIGNLCSVLEDAGFPATPFDDMQAWMRYHAIWIVPLGFLGRDGPASDFARALHEGHAALQAQGHPVSPPGLEWVLAIPTFVLTLGVAVVRMLPGVRRRSREALAAGGGENLVLARQIVTLAEASGIEVPTWRGWARPT